MSLTRFRQRYVGAHGVGSASSISSHIHVGCLEAFVEENIFIGGLSNGAGILFLLLLLLLYVPQAVPDSSLAPKVIFCTFFQLF